MDEAPAIFKTPGRKKKPLKVKEKLDDSFLKRSKRISNKLQGFKDEESARKAKSAAVNINAEEEAADVVIEPMPQPSSHLGHLEVVLHLTLVVTS